MLGCVIINTDRSELPNLCTAQATRAGTTRADIRAAWGPLYLFHAICIQQSGIKIFDEKYIQNYTKTLGIIARSIWNREEVKKFWQL